MLYCSEGGVGMLGSLGRINANKKKKSLGGDDRGVVRLAGEHA